MRCRVLSALVVCCLVAGAQTIDLVKLRSFIESSKQMKLTDAEVAKGLKTVKLTEKLPKGEAYLETECPRGQMGFYIVSDGTAIPWRARARSSSFCNLSPTNELCRGCLIADVPAIVGSLDIVMGEIDR